MTREAEHELRRGHRRTGDAGRAAAARTRSQNFSRDGPPDRRLPKLKAAIDTDDPPTVSNRAGLQAQLEPNLSLVTDRPARCSPRPDGSRAAATPRRSRPSAKRSPGTRASRLLAAAERHPSGRHRAGLFDRPRPRSSARSAPASCLDDGVGRAAQEDDRQRRRLRQDGQILASTLPRESTPRSRAAPLATAHRSASSRVTLSAAKRALPRAASARRKRRRADRAGGAHPPLAHRAAALPAARSIRVLALTAVLAVLAATLLSYAVARTITRPLGGDHRRRCARWRPPAT